MTHNNGPNAVAMLTNDAEMQQANKSKAGVYNLNQGNKGGGHCHLIVVGRSATLNPS